MPLRCGLGTGGAADAVVDAIAWIARQQVAVINVSLVGPKNVLLENVVRLVIARGHIVRLVEDIKPAVEMHRGRSGDLVEHAVRGNVAEWLDAA